MKSLANILAILGFAALGYWGAVTLKARLYQMREQKHFSAPPSRPNPQPTLPPASKPTPRPGTVFAMLIIPRIGLSTVVVEGAEKRELELGPGHIPGTPMPGEGGNVGVAGHRDTFFRPLRHIRADDTIRLISHEQEFRYKVVSTQIVDPENVGVLSPTGRESLTLITCYPFQFVGSAPKRFIVRADCIDCAAAASKPAAASQTMGRIRHSRHLSAAADDGAQKGDIACSSFTTSLWCWRPLSWAACCSGVCVSHPSWAMY